MARFLLMVAVFAVGAALAGCSAPQSSAAFGSASLPATRPAARTNLNAVAGIGAVTAMSSLFNTYADENAAEPASTPKGGKGRCRNGHEFFAPDKAATPSSTETIDFFDAACTQVARDAVRVWTPGSQPSSESVTRTVRIYAGGGATPTSVRTETTSYRNATFGAYGFPVVADGFDRETSSTLNVGVTARNVVSDSETVMQSSSTSVNGYCTDSAGYDAAGIKRLDLSFGWQGGVLSGGTRTSNDDGSVTWNATHSGASDEAPIGAFSIATGPSNAACPIASPAYTLEGGTVRGDYTIPIALTYASGIIRSVTVSSAALADGNTLDVTTNTAVAPGSLNFIRGTVANATGIIATFQVNAYGTGTLTVSKTSIEYSVVGWSVIR